MSKQESRRAACVFFRGGGDKGVLQQQSSNTNTRHVGQGSCEGTTGGSRAHDTSRAVTWTFTCSVWGGGGGGRGGEGEGIDAGEGGITDNLQTPLVNPSLLHPPLLPPLPPLLPSVVQCTSNPLASAKAAASLAQ